MSQETELTEDDLAPGNSCPECGEDILTWRAIQRRDTEQFENDRCWVPADEVEPTGLTTSFSGNIILIAHNEV